MCKRKSKCEKNEDKMKHYAFLDTHSCALSNNKVFDIWFNAVATVAANAAATDAALPKAETAKRPQEIFNLYTINGNFEFSKFQG